MAEERRRGMAWIVAGLVFIEAGFLLLGQGSWGAGAPTRVVNTSRDINPAIRMTGDQKWTGPHEFGGSLFLTGPAPGPGQLLRTDSLGLISAVGIGPGLMFDGATLINTAAAPADTDTLASVTARGAATTVPSAFSGGLTSSGSTWLSGLPGTGDRLLYGADGTGLVSPVTVGYGLQFTGGTLQAAGPPVEGHTVVVAASDTLNPARADVVYRCTGTGDQAVLNAAIASLGAKGGVVKLLEGTYNLSGPVTILLSNVTLQGSGDNTVLKRLYNETILGEGLLLVGDGVNPLTGAGIRDLKVDGNKAAYSSNFNNSIRLKAGISDSRVLACAVINAGGSGIYVGPNNNERVTIEGCRVEGTAGSYGIYLNGTAGSSVVNCTVKGGQYGIDSWSGTRSRVIGNHVEGVTKSSYWIDTCQGSTLSCNTATGGGAANYPTYDLRGVTYCAFTGNAAQGNGGHGFQLYNDQDCTFTGNTSQGSVQSGVYVNSCARLSVVGNGVAGSTQYGIRLYNATTGCAVLGNVVAENGGSGTYSSISVEGTCSDDLILGNRVSDTAGSGASAGIEIQSGAARTYLAGNQLTGTYGALVNDSGTGTLYGGQTTGEADGKLKVGRMKGAGTGLAAGNWSASAGWGSTSAVTASGTDGGGVVTVAAGGTGQAANPTLTLTFADGTWTNAPVAVASWESASTGTPAVVGVTTTATTLVLTYYGTPAAGSTYKLSFQVRG